MRKATVGKRQSESYLCAFSVKAWCSLIQIQLVVLFAFISFLLNQRDTFRDNWGGRNQLRKYLRWPRNARVPHQYASAPGLHYASLIKPPLQVPRPFLLQNRHLIMTPDGKLECDEHSQFPSNQEMIFSSSTITAFMGVNVVVHFMLISVLIRFVVFSCLLV